LKRLSRAYRKGSADTLVELEEFCSMTKSQAARWGVVAVFALSSTWNYLDRQVLTAAAPRLRAEFHLSNTDYGWLLSAWSIAYMLASPGIGWLLDRIGLQIGIVYAVALWSLSSALGAITRTFGQLAGTRAALGAFESVGFPAAGKLNAIYLEPKNRALGAAMAQVGISVAGVVAPVLVATMPGWRQPFLASAALGVLWIPLWILVHRRVIPYQDVPPQRTNHGFAVLRDRRLRLLVVANVLWMGSYSLWTNWTTPYLNYTFGLSVESVAAYAWFPPVAATVGAFVGGWISRQAIVRGQPVVESRLFGILISATGCLVTLAVPLARTPLLATLAISVSYFWAVAGSVNIYTLPVDLWGGERAGTAISALVFAYGLLQTFISPVIGSIVDKHHAYAPACWMVALPPLGAWFLLRRLRVRPESPAS
jgi:MFS transporter, ACS family, hexuronate transporter